METEWVQQLPEWTPLAIGVLAILAALVLTILEHFGIIKVQEPEPEGCEYCGKLPVCEICGRCYDPHCNAGCIWCRTPPKPKTCPCCGQEVWR